MKQVLGAVCLTLAFVLPAALALGWDCDNIDAEIAKEMQAANADFAKANDYAESIRDKGTMQAVADVAEVLNPIPSVQSVIEDGFWSACARVLGATVTSGITATKKALEISAAIGNNQTSGVEGLINSLRKTGRVHLDNAQKALAWKKENCPCQEQSEADNLTTPETFSGGGVIVTILDEDSIEIVSDCGSKDSSMQLDTRIQLRTSGTWGTKSTSGNSVVVDGLHVGTRYQIRDRCDLEYREGLEFVFPESR